MKRRRLVLKIPKDGGGSHRKDAQVLAALYGLVHDLARTPDLQTIADCFFSHGRQLFDAEYGFLLLAESSGSELRGLAAYGPHTEGFADEIIQVRDEMAPTAVAFRQRRPVIVPDVAASPQVSERLRRKYHFVKSMWVVPLMNGTQEIGILTLGYATHRQPTAKELQLLPLLGDEAALAIAQRQREDELRQSEARLRVMFEKNRAVKLLIDPESGAILDANPAAADFYGYTRDDLRRMRITDLNVLPPAQVAAAMAQAVGEQQLSFRFQHRLASGALREVEVYSSPLLLHDRPLLYSIIHDVTDRVRAEEELRTLNTELEQRVVARTADLQWALSELQQLTRIAAHDLQEPVRVITSYVQLLAQNYQDRLDPEAHDLITTIVAGTKRLQRLMLDLLAYSEVSIRQLESTWVDCETLMTTIFADLRGAIADRGAVITHDLLPTVWGDAALLQLVFRNLIHNGIKFNDHAPPSVHVSADRLAGAWRFAIADNGTGIEPQLAERIFLPFQRLHVREPYPKPGIGLALSKKIIDRHGGRIWVESTPGQGSTLYFTLAEPDPEQ